jgi:hypothetical protein
MNAVRLKEFATKRIATCVVASQTASSALASATVIASPKTAKRSELIRGDREIDEVQAIVVRLYFMKVTSDVIPRTIIYAERVASPRQPTRSARHRPS